MAKNVQQSCITRCPKCSASITHTIQDCPTCYTNLKQHNRKSNGFLSAFTVAIFAAASCEDYLYAAPYALQADNA